MGYIPSDAKWFIGELVEEITVEGDPRNVVHRNIVLIEADSPELAYERALELGREADIEYDNQDGRRVVIRFRGIGALDVIHDELVHGAELMFYQSVGLTAEEVRQLIPPKEELEAFLPPARFHEGPDYGSAEVIAEVEHRFGIKRPE